MLYFVWRGLDVIVYDSISSRSCHALSSIDRDEVELVSVLFSDFSIDHGSSLSILVLAWLSSEQPRVDSLAAIDVHQLA